MKPVLFPATVAALMLGIWVVGAFVDLCLLQNNDPKFRCWAGLQVIMIFSCIGAVLTGLMAGLARAALNPFLAFRSAFPESLSAIVAAFVLTLVFYATLLWEPDIGGMGGIFFGWLFASFFICGAALVIVRRFVGNS